MTGDVAFACASALVDQLARAGVQHACLSPGSRSAPIALALARHPRIRVHVHLDERSSAFVALGIAKASGSPAAVVTTSGTAVANLLPAVVEADASRVPLVLLTADRPPDLRGVGANQTIDQARIFGERVRAFLEPDVPEEDVVGVWRDAGRRAASASLASPPGPVHLNLPFREPLLPETSGPAPSAAEPIPAPTRPPLDDEAVAWLADRIATTDRGVVVAGELREGAAVAGLAATADWPLLAEPTSGARVPGVALAAGQHLLADEVFAPAHPPEVVVQLGATPTSRASLAFVASAEELVVVTEHGRPADPAGAATRTIDAPDAHAFASAVADRLEPYRTGSWLEAWRDADARAAPAVDGLLAGWRTPFEGRVARDLAAALPDGSHLAVASSMPVRDLDAYMAPRDGLRVLANRGASGIDGFVSTTLGIAAAQRSAVGLCGDLSLLHDAGALLWASRRGYEATFVVLDNAGGHIFRVLRHAELPEGELFTTPHGLDLGTLASAAGAGYARVERGADLVRAVEAASGVHLVHVVSDPHEDLARRRAIAEAVRAALG